MPTPPPINLGPYALNAPSQLEKGNIRESLDLGSASLLQGGFIDSNRLVFSDPNDSQRTITLDKTQLNSAVADRLRTARVVNVTGHVTTTSPIPSFDGTEDLYIPVTINDGVISELMLATNAVVGAKIKNGTITPDKLSGTFPDWGNVGTMLIKQPVIELGSDITANGNSYIDFHSSFPLVDYDARIWRRPGVNGELDVLNTGTGDINIGGGLSINSANTVISTRQLIGAIEIIGNQINGTFANNVEPVALNYENSDSTIANFLNTTVFDGKRQIAAKFFGETKTLETYGPCRSITNGQIAVATAGLESRSTSGNVLIALAASGTGGTSTLLRHVRGGAGVEIRTADDVNYAPLKASNVNTTGDITINEESPTLILQDTNNRSAMVHVNSNQFYVLRGSATNSTTWESINNAWPLQIDLENNYATLGGGAKINGTLSVTGDVIAYSTSDKDLKTNIKNIEQPLSKIQKINGVTFDWDTSKQDTHSGSDIGVVAQEIEEILPDAVCTREDGYKAVKYEKIIPLLIESVKELTALVETLQTKIANLENQ
jgi:hypothetical protein